MQHVNMECYIAILLQLDIAKPGTFVRYRIFGNGSPIPVFGIVFGFRI